MHAFSKVAAAVLKVRMHVILVANRLPICKDVLITRLIFDLVNHLLQAKNQCLYNLNHFYPSLVMPFDIFMAYFEAFSKTRQWLHTYWEILELFAENPLILI
ncbi:hypothetical protein COEREDRAFT_89989 [Coemansia reversa NRRL 1564]|uniref:Uncharacterized protein n=1 Tax=Coemansia reversa (strain ATCC 12441 / NRRL 1564) TaxID=763665 RepID=A0A2G5B1N3_COERN|nr:hypothetical protein COEREDRAFT_89989 [Coemansia reversa NRRL 1564]|eukprot:PIA12906.1 hypothetical protein COEREDRAFT_89989 [Coemansia reversa NRRL 1564]